jgi:hypothetical protein
VHQRDEFSNSPSPLELVHNAFQFLSLRGRKEFSAISGKQRRFLIVGQNGMAREGESFIFNPSPATPRADDDDNFLNGRGESLGDN